MSYVTDRHLTFERCFNFRDLGGYAGCDGRLVRRRRLFRSMTPQFMSEADAIAVRSLDIGLVIDFRGLRYDTSGPVGNPPARRLALGPDFSGAPTAAVERWFSMAPEEALPMTLENYGPYFAGAVTAIAAAPKTNVLFHCQLGKDRTGVFAALLLKLLGARDEDVIYDYMMTAANEADVRRLILETNPDTFEHTPRLAAEPVAPLNMEGVLQRLVSQHCGARGYLAKYGVGAETVDAFVEAFLEPAAAAASSALEQAASGS